MPKLAPDRFLVEHTPGTGGDSPSNTQFIAHVGGLTQFGVNIETLPTGAYSSIKHWHSDEDELVYVLDGEVTLIEGDTEAVLSAGDAATFRAGDPVGHCLVNRSAAPTRCMIVGSRAQLDRITYPDHDRVCHRARGSSDDVWTDMAGRPASNPYADL